MDSNDLLSLSKLNILLRFGNDTNSKSMEALKNELEKNKDTELTNLQKLLHYNKLDFNTERFIAEYDSTTCSSSNSLATSNKCTLDTPIVVNFNNTPIQTSCPIEFYRNCLGAITFYDFTGRESELTLSYAYEDADQLVEAHPNMYIYQTVLLLDSAKLEGLKRSESIIRQVLGRNSLVFVSNITVARYVIFDSVRYICELLRLELKKLKANATPDIKTPFDVKQNFSNVPLKLITGKKWIHSNGRNRKRMGDINLILGKNLESMELYQQSFSSSKHTGDRLFRAASQFGMAICLQKCYIQLKNPTYSKGTLMTSNLRKLHSIIAYLEHCKTRDRKGNKLYEKHAATISEDGLSDDSSDHSSNSAQYNKPCNSNPGDCRREILHSVRLCLFGCFSTFMRLKVFPFKTFFEMARVSCSYFIQVDMLHEFFEVLSMLSAFLSHDYDGKMEWLGDVVGHLSTNPRCSRKLAFYTLEIASDDSLNSQVALQACRFVAHKLSLGACWEAPPPTQCGWFEIQFRLLDIAYGAAASLGLWEEANQLLWSMLCLFTTGGRGCRTNAIKILHGLETTSLLSAPRAGVDGQTIASIIRLKSIKPNLGQARRGDISQACSARIGTILHTTGDVAQTLSGGQYRIKLSEKVDGRTFRAKKRVSSLRLIQNRDEIDLPSNNSVFHVLSNSAKARGGDCVEHQVILGNEGQWETGTDELVTITLVNGLNSPITVKSLQLITKNVECVSVPLTAKLEPGPNSLIQSTTPLDTGRLAITGVRLTVANKTFDFSLTKSIVIYVRRRNDVHAHIELLPIMTAVPGGMNLAVGPAPLPMLFNKPKLARLCKCTEEAPCTRLCSTVIAKSTQKPIDTTGEVLYEGEVRLGLFRVQNMSDITISGLKVSFGIGDWRSSRLSTSPIVFIASKSRMASSSFSIGDDLISSRTLFCADGTKSIDSPRLNLSSRGSCVELAPGSHVAIPFILHASSWANDMSIRISWTHAQSARSSRSTNTSRPNDTSHSSLSSRSLHLQSARHEGFYGPDNYTEAKICNLVDIPVALAEGGLEAYHLVSLDSQMAESVCLGKIKCLRPYYISEFDNPSVILRITLRNLTHSAVYFEAGEGRMGQEVMLRPHDNTSVSIICARVPGSVKGVLQHLDRVLRLRWRVGDRSGGLYLSRLAKLVIKRREGAGGYKQGQMQRYNQGYKMKIAKYAAPMATWRRGVYSKFLPDTRTVLDLADPDILYQPEISLHVICDEEIVRINTPFTIRVRVSNEKCNDITNGWLFALAYDAKFDHSNNSTELLSDGDVAFATVENSIFCSGFMEKRLLDAQNIDSTGFNFIAVRSGEYKIAVGLVCEDFGKVIWHHEPVKVRVIPEG